MALSDLFSAFEAIAPVAKTGFGAYQQFKGYQGARRAERGRTQAERNAEELLAAITNPERSALFKSRLAQETGLLTDAMQQNITQQRLADRRGMLRGQRPSFFNPERADENIDYFTSRGMPAIMSQARSNVLSQLMQSANGYKELATNGYAQRGQAAKNMYDSGADTFSSGYADLLKQIQKYQKPEITWDQPNQTMMY